MGTKMSPEEIKIYKAIDKILWNDWDPIGINTIGVRDEYQMYFPKIYRLKTNNADNEIIAQALYQIETERMGLSGNINHCRQIANMIELL